MGKQSDHDLLIKINDKVDNILLTLGTREKPGVVSDVISLQNTRIKMYTAIKVATVTLTAISILIGLYIRQFIEDVASHIYALGR